MEELKSEDSEDKVILTMSVDGNNIPPDEKKKLHEDINLYETSNIQIYGVYQRK